MFLSEINCGFLDAPDHGVEQSSNDVVDSVVSFSCDRGYRLQGSANRTCTTQGTWDGVETMCVGQSLINNSHVLVNSAVCARKGLINLTVLR